MDAQRQQARTRTGPLSVVQWFLTRLVVAAVILVLGFFGYRYVFIDQLDEQIRLKLETKLRDHYQGLIVKIESARRIEGEGIEIRGLSIAEANRRSEPPLVYVERIMATCNVSLPDLITKEPVVSQLVVRRAHVHAVRRTNGFWNVRHLFPPPKFSDRSPPIALEDCSAEVVDDAHPERDAPQWRNVELALTPDVVAGELLGLAAGDADCAIRIEGSMTGDHFREVRLEGEADLASALWSLRGEVDQLQFSPAMREKLPQDLAAVVTPIAAVSGNTHLRFDVHNLDGPDAPLQFHVAGEISEGRIDDDRLPLPLTELEAKLFADNEGLKIDDLTARLGAASVQLSLRLDGFDHASTMTIRMAAENLALDERFAQSLPPDALKLWNQLLPSGFASGKLLLEFNGESWQPELDAKLEQLTFLYEKFPYRMSDGEATVTLRNDMLTIKGTASAGNSPVLLEAEVYNAGPDWHGWLEARSQEALPIDERLLSALSEKSREVVQSFSPRGNVQLAGRWDRRAGSPNPPHANLEVQLCDCSIIYRLFAYPIDHITGTLRSSDGVWSFVNLKGSQGSSQIQCSGGFGPDGARGSLLTMDFRCQDVALDETLRKSLPPQHQQLWNDIRPRGELEALGVNLSYHPSERKLSLEVDAQKVERRGDRSQRALRVEPVWFPYAMDLTSGSLRYRDGIVQLSKLRGTHGKTKLAADGTCRWTGDGEWSFDLERFLADHLQLDHELLSALPGEAGNALAKAKFSGGLNMAGNLRFSGQKGTSPNAAWDLAFDVEEGQIAGETSVEHIQGEIRVVGGLEAGSWFSRGDVNLDSLFINDVQLTTVRGPFYLDSKQLLLGAWADRDIKKLPPRRLTAQVFDGLLSTDGVIALDDDGRFTLEASLDQASLSKIAQETGASAPDISGKIYGALQMTGTTRGKHTWQGSGNVRLREAYLYKVPVMLKIVNVLSSEDSTFTSSDINFRLQGDDVLLDRIDLAGDRISLRGRGRLFEQEQIDLQFYTQVGRQELLALRPLVAEASYNFLLIEVSGTVDSPSVKKTAFPALNETLRELFPDLARDNGAAANEAKMQPRSLLSRPGNFWRR